MVDICFFGDIFIVTRTGWIDRGVMRLDRESIKSHYPCWRLIYGWVYPWPYYVIGYLTNNNTVYLILLIPKVMRLLRLGEAYQVIRSHLVYINARSHMFTLCITLLTVVHLFACLAWLLGHTEREQGVMSNWLDEYDLIDKVPFEQYFRFFYFMLATVTTIGYGDVHAVTFAEMLFVVFCEIVGVFIYNYIVSNFVVILSDPSRQRFLAKWKRVYRTFRSRGLTDKGLKEMLWYYEYIWVHDKNRELFYENTRQLMPIGLQKRIRLALHVSLFRSMGSVNDSPGHEATLERIAIALRPRIFTPGDTLARAGRVSKSLFFVTRGRVQVVSNTGVLVTAFDGDNTAVFGEMSIIDHGRESCTYIAETYVEAFELTSADYERIMHIDPTVRLRRGIHRLTDAL
jgi:hypothetical protein